jgi:hypothetical protein
MMRANDSGSALAVGLILLSLISLLGLSGASAAHVELQLARNEQFRENAAAAASAGIESVISRIVSSANPDIPDLHASLPGNGRFEASARFLGYETGVPQQPGSNLTGAHFEIIATGHSPRGGFDRQRAIVVLVVHSPAAVATSECEPLAPAVPCAAAGDLSRLAWQRLPRP